MTDWTRKGEGTSTGESDCLGNQNNGASQIVTNLIDGDLTTFWNAGFYGTSNFGCTSSNGEYFVLFDMGADFPASGFRMASPEATTDHNPDEVSWYSCPESTLSPPGSQLASSHPGQRLHHQAVGTLGTFGISGDPGVDQWS